MGILKTHATRLYSTTLKGCFQGVRELSSFLKPNATKQRKFWRKPPNLCFVAKEDSQTPESKGSLFFFSFTVNTNLFLWFSLYSYGSLLWDYFSFKTQKKRRQAVIAMGIKTMTLF
ncbi:MAG: hypothetical protein K2W94_08080 [Alphaproteobacteria bacterium]|nr:hypothetical protein [Alphaproteobacteria bacterium]